MKKSKNVLRIMEAPIALFEKLYKETKLNSLELKLNSEEKVGESQGKINNMELWDKAFKSEPFLEKLLIIIQKK